MTSQTFARYVALALFLATFVGFETAQAAEIVHEVQKGQNLGMIAKRYHTTPKVIRKRNKLSVKKKIYPGQKLRIPESAEHRKWLKFYEEKLAPKKKPPKKEVKKSSPKAERKPKPSKRAAKSKRPAAPRAKAKKRAARKAPTKRRATKRSRASQRAKKARAASRYEKNRARASKYRKAPRRRGQVTVARFGRRHRTTLISKDGRVRDKAAKRLDRFMRSWRTGEKHPIDRRLYRLLAQVSDHFGGRRIVVVSGYRPVRKNQFTKNSRHNHGKAIDFRIVGVPNKDVFNYCKGFANVGCGYYPNSNFIHMDVRTYKTQWTDYSRPGQAPIYAHKRTRSKSKARRVEPEKSKRKASNKAKKTASVTPKARRSKSTKSTDKKKPAKRNGGGKSGRTSTKSR